MSPHVSHSSKISTTLHTLDLVVEEVAFFSPPPQSPPGSPTLPQACCRKSIAHCHLVNRPEGWQDCLSSRNVHLLIIVIVVIVTEADIPTAATFPGRPIIAFQPTIQVWEKI
jgi:hypothetical protein